MASWYAKSSALPAAPAQHHSLANWSLGRARRTKHGRGHWLTDRANFRLPTHSGGIHFRNLKLAGASNEPGFSWIDPARFSWSSA